MSEDPQATPGTPSKDPHGPFAPYVSKRTGPGTGPDWAGPWPEASIRRIRASATVEEAGVQATTEAVILLHSIRKMLLWTLIIIPLLAVGLFITMAVIANASEPAVCTSVYSCR